MDAKRYLGDSVYAELDGWTIKLTTEYGQPEDPSNIIWLEPEVIKALIAYVEDMAAKPPIIQPKETA